MSSVDEDSTSDAELGDTRHLVARIREGDVDGFKRLYERVAPSLYAWARVRSNPAQGISLDPEDLLQEVWLRAYENLSQYDGARASFRSWIFGIAKNVAYEGLRHRSSNPSPGAASGSTNSAVDGWAAVSTSVRSRMAKEETIQLLMGQLNDFDPVDRMLVVHCGMEDVSSRVVATRLGMSEEAVAKRWQRLRERLRASSFAELLEL